MLPASQQLLTQLTAEAKGAIEQFGRPIDSVKPVAVLYDVASDFYQPENLIPPEREITPSAGVKLELKPILWSESRSSFK